MSQAKSSRRTAKSAPQPPPTAPQISLVGRLAANDLVRSLAFVALLSVVGYFTYRGSLEGRLFFDDITSVEHNPHVFALVDPATRRQWSTWVFAATSERDTPFAGRPVVALSFALNHWWATAMSPSGIRDFIGVLPIHIPYFHYVNTALHVAVAALLYGLVRRTLRTPVFAGRFDSSADAWAALGALVWLVHPLNTETVVYVTQRTEQLVSLFLLSTLYANLRAFEAVDMRKRLAWQVVAVVGCALGMASKENMIAAPLLVAAYDRAFCFSSWREAFRRRIWYYVAVAATWLVLLEIMRNSPRGSSVGFDHGFPWYDYLITQCWCIGRYVRLSLLPLGNELCLDYGRRPVLDVAQVAPGALVIVAGLGAAIWGLLRRPWVGFLGAWFFFILAPTSSVVPIVTEVGAERRMYLPLASVLAAVGVGLGAAWSAWASAGKLARPRPGRARKFMTSAGMALVACSVVGWLGYTSHERNKVFLDDYTLYGHVVAVMPDNDRGLNNYGKVLLDRGLIGHAFVVLNRALQLDPQYSDVLSNRAVARFRHPHAHRPDLAIADTTEALRWNPYSVNAISNRGQAFYESTLLDQAAADYTRLIQITGGRTDAFLNRANVEIARAPRDPVAMGQALADVEQALAHNAYSFRAYLVRATILNNLDRPSEALAAIATSLDNFRRETTTLKHQAATRPLWEAEELLLTSVDLRRRPLPPKVVAALAGYPHRGTLAHLLKERARSERLLGEKANDSAASRRAFDDLTRLTLLDPQNPEYLSERAAMYVVAKRYGEAALDYRQALSLDADYRPALRGDADLAMQLGDFGKAWADARRLRDLGEPLDDAKLEQLRKLSGGDYP